MIVVCLLHFIINSGNHNWVVNGDFTGKVKNESHSKYLVDFTEGFKDYPLPLKPEDYNNRMVDKNDCIGLLNENI